MKKLVIASVLLSVTFNSPLLLATGTCNTNAAVDAADQKWAATLTLHDPKKMADLYQHDAILLGTYENIPLLSYEQRVEYFTALFKKIPNIRVEYNSKHYKFFKDDAISTGLYTFIGDEEGKEIRIPARYTFAYDSADTGCRLIMHHSSALPIQYKDEDAIH